MVASLFIGSLVPWCLCYQLIQEIGNCFKLFDRDGNGLISYDEFLRGARVKQATMCMCHQQLKLDMVPAHSHTLTPMPCWLVILGAGRDERPTQGLGAPGV